MVLCAAIFNFTHDGRQFFLKFEVDLKKGKKKKVGNLLTCTKMLRKITQQTSCRFILLNKLKNSNNFLQLSILLKPLNLVSSMKFKMERVFLNHHIHKNESLSRIEWAKKTRCNLVRDKIWLLQHGQFCWTWWWIHYYNCLTKRLHDDIGINLKFKGNHDWESQYHSVCQGLIKSKLNSSSKYMPSYIYSPEGTVLKNTILSIFKTRLVSHTKRTEKKYC